MAKHSFDKVLMLETPAGRRATRVIVLNDTEEGVIYIPMNGITRVDYKRLKDLYDDTDKDTLLAAMRDERLDMGKNALITYQDVIKTYRNDPEPEKKEPEPNPTPAPEKQAETSEESKPTRRKPGPKKGSRNKPKATDKSEQGSDSSEGES